MGAAEPWSHGAHRSRQDRAVEHDVFGKQLVHLDLFDSVSSIAEIEQRLVIAAHRLGISRSQLSTTVAE